MVQYLFLWGDPLISLLCLGGGEDILFLLCGDGLLSILFLGGGEGLDLRLRGDGLDLLRRGDGLDLLLRGERLGLLLWCEDSTLLSRLLLTGDAGLDLLRLGGESLLSLRFLEFSNVLGGDCLLGCEASLSFLLLGTTLISLLIQSIFEH